MLLCLHIGNLSSTHGLIAEEVEYLDQAGDWAMTADLGTRHFFPEIVTTTLRSDIVLWSQKRKVIAIELTVP